MWFCFRSHYVRIRHSSVYLNLSARSYSTSLQVASMTPRVPYTSSGRRLFSNDALKYSQPTAIDIALIIVKNMLDWPYIEDRWSQVATGIWCAVSYRRALLRIRWTENACFKDILKQHEHSCFYDNSWKLMATDRVANTQQLEIEELSWRINLSSIQAKTVPNKENLTK